MFRTHVFVIASVLALSGAAYAQDPTTPPEHPRGEAARCRFERKGTWFDVTENTQFPNLE